MTSHMRVPYASPSCDSYGRTDGRTNEESWLSRVDHLTLRNAHAHIRISPFAPIAQARTELQEKP
jgi:hypothetical protein